MEKINIDQLMQLVQWIVTVAVIAFSAYKVYKAKGTAGLLEMGEAWLPNLLRTLETAYGPCTGAEKLKAAKDFIIENELKLPNTGLSVGDEGFDAALVQTIEDTLSEAKKRWAGDNKKWRWFR